MKQKIIVLLSFLLLVAGSAFAAGGIPTTTDGTKPFTFKASNNVSILYTVDGGGTLTANQNYAAASKNMAGNRVYATGNSSSNIYYLEVANNGSVGKDVTDTAAWTGGTKPAAGVLTSTGMTSQ